MYCASCGTQNADTNKFCLRCGNALPEMPARYTSPTPPAPPQTSIKPAQPVARPPANPVVPATWIGGLAGIVGGALVLIGWLMPWTNAIITTFSGLQITVAVLTATVAMLSIAQNGLGGVILVLLGLGLTVLLVSIPILGLLCIRSGMRPFEYHFAAQHMVQVDDRLDELRSRSLKGIVLTVLIVVVPLILSTLLVAVLPFMVFATQLTSLLPNNGIGSGLFLTAGGFLLAYIGARVGQYVLDSAPATESKALVFGRTDPSPATTPAADTGATGILWLTDTEKQVLSLLAQGVEENGLALRMAVPDSMVIRTMADLYSKFNVTSRNELVTLAKQKQLV